MYGKGHITKVVYKLFFLCRILVQQLMDWRKPKINCVFSLKVILCLLSKQSIESENGLATMKVCFSALFSVSVSVEFLFVSSIGFGCVFHSNFHLNAFSNLICRSRTSIRLELVYVVICVIGHFGRSNRLIKTAMVKNRMKIKMCMNG